MIGNGIKLKRESKLFNTVSMGAEIFLKSGRCSNSHSLIFQSIHLMECIFRNPMGLILNSLKLT